MKQFDKVAKVYAKVRPTYPGDVYNSILGWSSKNALYRCAVDIGCGAGHSIEGLTAICKTVIGVEPGDNLREEAIKKYPDYVFFKGTGEETNLPDGVADLVTIATAFYWMDRNKTLHEVSRVLQPGGVLALYRYLFPKICSDANVIIENHCRLYWDKYRDERLTRPDDSDVLIRTSELFSTVAKCKVDNIWKLSIEDFVGFLSSTSYVSKYMETLPDGGESYLKGLTQELIHASAGDMLDVNFDIHMVLAKRK